MDPKWRSAYLSAEEQRKKAVFIYFFGAFLLIALLVTTFIVLNFYNRQRNASKLIETTLISSSNPAIESSILNQVEAGFEQTITQDESYYGSEDIMGNQYYRQMKDAWQRAQDYRDSISDPEIKNSVQTPEGAVNGKYSVLLDQHPEDEQLIINAYEKIVNGE